MDDIMRLDDPLTYPELMELTFDGLAVRLTPETWIPVGVAVDAQLRARALCPAPLPDLVASHRSAHWVWWGAGAAPLTPEFTTRQRRRIRAAGLPVTIHERTVDPEDADEISGLALTTPERTLYDLFYGLVDAEGDRIATRAAAARILDCVSYEERISFARYLTRQYRRPLLARIRALFISLFPPAVTLLRPR